ncbi:hypothetical protein BHE74_00049266, partial [Ensete ventricosum]
MALEADSTMEDLKAALNEHVDLVSELLEKFSAELRSGFGPAVDNFVGFFHAIDWKVLSGVYFAERINSFLGKNWKSFSSQNYFDPHGVFISVLWSGPLLVLTILIVVSCHASPYFSGVYFAEWINSFLGKNWKSFSSQNYFDPHGLFISVLWSGPLLVL